MSSEDPSAVLPRTGPLKFLNAWARRQDSQEESEPRRRNKGKGPATDEHDHEQPAGPEPKKDKPAGPPGGPPPNPKGFFANERTFLSWMNLVLVLGALAVGLVNFGDKMAQTAGVIFTVISLGFMFYALLRFWERAERLENKEKSVKFEDMIGSLILVSVVFLAVGVNFALRFINH
ncbi:hypothetical protein HK097_011615 [Rhizophlyctis rosea]|uniref:DUF202 domain-containing protein n=1 Tax=Rhizophlyctis rosea TaxID=64517 RepID=A0AAD5SJM3_9FUNG|nr:hypothetical protein HK097_011615 [Rhizophlyctis rosea]